MGTETEGHSSYVGRFAPSPTGPLHFGSVVAALASYLDARHANGRWLVRIEDLDPPRESIEAPRQILSQLDAFRLEFDGEVLYQSNRLDAYRSALAALENGNLVFPCTCTRKETPPVYPGTCRERTFSTTTEDYAVRLRVDDRDIVIDDTCLGQRRWNLLRECGDFIIRRKDGLFAYQLAVVVDDAYQQITHVVRGNDLLDSTPRQVYLGDCLDLPRLEYLHFPVILGDDGDKLSKQTHAAPVDTDDPLPIIRLALKALGQTVHVGLGHDATIARAIDEWDTARIPGREGIALSDLVSP